MLCGGSGNCEGRAAEQNCRILRGVMPSVAENCSLKNSAWMQLVPRRL